MRPATAVLIGLVTASALLTACGTDGTDAPPSGPAHRPPAFPKDTAHQEGRGSGGTPTVFTDVRVDGRQGFDRIVLEFSGAGTPGWSVGYVDEATVEGSGEVVALRGDRILDIHTSNTTWPAPDYYDGPSRLRAETGNLTEVYVVGTIEGYTHVFAGLDGPRAPFRVVALTHPARLVIDVVDDGPIRR